MKKTLFSFAIAAATLALVACGNKGQQAAETTDEQTEQTAEVASEGGTVEKKNFSVAYPAKFVLNDQFPEENEAIIYIPDPDSEYGTLGQVVVRAKNNWTSGLDMYVQQDINSAGGTAALADDVTIGGTTYKVVKHDALDNPIYLYAELPEQGVAEIGIRKLTLDDPDVKSIIESIKWK